MRYFYERNSDSLYIALAERRAYHDSVEAAPGVVLDFDAQGKLLGIDLEHASKTVDVANIELLEEPTNADTKAARLDGTKLRREREHLGLSQLELARRLSVSTNTVARWERGELKIQHPAMLQLALLSLRRGGATAEGRASEATSSESSKKTRGGARPQRSISGKLVSVADRKRNQQSSASRRAKRK